MKILKILLMVALISVFFTQATNAEKIIDVELIVFQNDTVIEKTINITEGRYSQIWKTGDYTLEFLDKNGKVIGQQSINVFFGYSGPVSLNQTKPDDKLFDSYFLSYRHPYSPEIKTVVLRHFDKVIFSKDIECVDCPKNGTGTIMVNLLIVTALIAISLIIVYKMYKKRGDRWESL